jgi:uncharacterized OB-fold protein
MSNSKCSKCGTVYLEPVEECDWCPGQKPVITENIEDKNGLERNHPTNASDV